MSKPLRALFGGTFDPVHRGHTGAVAALDALVGFAAVHFVLSARPPHKEMPGASIAERFTLLELALTDHPSFQPDDTELKRTSLSYTEDTVAAFSERYPDDRLALIIGADSLLTLPSWRNIARWFDTINWLVLARPGVDLDDFPFRERRVDSVQAWRNAPGGALYLFESTDFAVSSTQIRSYLRRPESLNAEEADYLRANLAEPVYNYIQLQHLYQLCNPSRSSNR